MLYSPPLTAMAAGAVIPATVMAFDVAVAPRATLVWAVKLKLSGVVSEGALGRRVGASARRSPLPGFITSRFVRRCVGDAGHGARRRFRQRHLIRGSVRRRSGRRSSRGDVRWRVDR